jgi:hypothetical protein
MMSREGKSSDAVVRRVLKSMPARVPPPELTTRLRVIASREAARRRSRTSPVAAFVEMFRSCAQNMMRPLAIPTAGGFVSALLLFGVLAPSLAWREVAVAKPASIDVPTVLYAEPSLKRLEPIECEGHNVVLELTVNERGRVLDYKVPDGVDPDMIRRTIGTHLEHMEFYPATTFGQPTSGKVRLWLRSSRIDIKG